MIIDTDTIDPILTIMTDDRFVGDHDKRGMIEGMKKPNTTGESKTTKIDGDAVSGT